MNQLKYKLEKLIKSDSVDQLKELLTVDSLKNVYVSYELNRIVSIIVSDRNNDKKFTIEDLQLLSQDPMAVTSLISSILIILSQVSKIKYEEEVTEEIILKLLCYIFLIIVPSHTKSTLSISDKLQILEISLNIYNVIKSTQMIQTIINKIKKWIKSKCTKSNDEKDLILQGKLIKHKTLLSYSVQTAKLQSQINNL